MEAAFSGVKSSDTIIILDLEWNSAYCKWQNRFLNEIIEFGAVKLDKDLNEIDRFQCFVRSRLTNRLRSKFKGLTNITNDQMRSGINFDEAVKRYTEWAGENTLTLTWSNSDIYTLLDNMKTLLDTDTLPFIYRYADMQKFVQEQLGITQNQISLTAAAERLNVDFAEFAAHRALGDALCSAQLLRRTWIEGGIDKYIVDTTNPEYYERLRFKPYIISDINSSLIDKSQLRFKCPQCNNYLKRCSKWKFKNRYFKAQVHCSNCDKDFIGRIRFKKLFDSVAVSKYVAEPVPEQEEAAQNEN